VRRGRRRLRVAAALLFLPHARFFRRSHVARYVFAASKAVFTGAYDKNRRHGEGVMV
jgi:hypothetical protein